MSLRPPLWILFLAPVLALAGVLAFELTVPVPHLGRSYVLRMQLPDPEAQLDLPQIHGPQDSSMPLVLLDPGHGGHDPGASRDGYREKAIVLGLAQALRDRLVEDGGIRVALTRENDHFLVLEERAELARRMGADLFLSIHADSAGGKEAVQGASVYILSGRASSEAAELFAQRENGADRINGVRIEDAEDAVSAILVDLSQRRTQEQSAEFARLIEREGGEALQFHSDAQRSASLVVLRAPDVPSVLFEAGFVTNPQDAARLASPEGKARFAEVMDRAIRVYFARNPVVG